MANNPNHKDNLKPFKKGQSGNPKGRPKKIVTKVLESLKEEGEIVTKSMVKDVYQVFLSLTQAQLKKIQKDAKQPMINRIVAEAMLSDKSFEVLEKMLDRANGKPTQSQEVDHTSNGKDIGVLPIDWINDKPK